MTEQTNLFLNFESFEFEFDRLRMINTSWILLNLNKIIIFFKIGSLALTLDFNEFN